MKKILPKSEKKTKNPDRPFTREILNTRFHRKYKSEGQFNKDFSIANI